MQIEEVKRNIGKMVAYQGKKRCLPIDRLYIAKR